MRKRSGTTRATTIRELKEIQIYPLTAENPFYQAAQEIAGRHDIHFSDILLDNSSPDMLWVTTEHPDDEHWNQRHTLHVDGAVLAFMSPEEMVPLIEMQAAVLAYQQHFNNEQSRVLSPLLAIIILSGVGVLADMMHALPNHAGDLAWYAEIAALIHYARKCESLSPEERVLYGDSMLSDPAGAAYALAKYEFLLCAMNERTLGETMDHFAQSTENTPSTDLRMERLIDAAREWETLVESLENLDIWVPIPPLDDTASLRSILKMHADKAIQNQETALAAQDGEMIDPLAAWSAWLNRSGTPEQTARDSGRTDSPERKLPDREPLAAQPDDYFTARHKREKAGQRPYAQNDRSPR